MERINCISAAAFAVAVLFSADAVAKSFVLNERGVIRMVVAEDGAPVLLSRGETYRTVSLGASGIELLPRDKVIESRAPEGGLRDGLVASDRDGRRAWLDQPTDRYGHAVLGDGIEAGGLTVEHPGGGRLSLTLEEDEVFEDRYPRFADMDGDGRDEILTVKAYRSAGGALVLVDPGTPGTPPKIVAEAPAIGTPNRWLNPVGVGDVDGDGRMEALVVITPHIGGTLTAYEWQGDKLVEDHKIFGFSNHAIGARELALSAVADLDEDGIPEAIVPNRRRTAVTVVSFQGAEPRIMDEIAVAAGVLTRVVVHDLDGDGRPEVTFGTRFDEVIVWQPQF